MSKVKSRGTVLHIGTKAVNHASDSYTEVPGTVTIAGTVGTKWSEIDVTELVDTEKQTMKGVLDRGRYTFTGNIHESVLSGLDAGLAALQAAADDDDDDTPYNIKLVKSNGRVKFLKVHLFEYNESINGQNNVHGFTCLAIVQAAPVQTAPSVPTNTVLPAISGSAAVGQVLTALEGVWTGHPSFTYQWKRDGVNIGAATAKTYTVVEADEGAAITVTVTGTNTAGTASATSGPTVDVPA